MKTYTDLALQAIKTATELDAQQTALDVLSIVEKADVRSRSKAMDAMLRKVRKSLETAL